MPTIYPSLTIGAANRLAMFKREAADPKKHWTQPMTWRNVRFATLKSHTGLDGGLNDNKPIWYCHDNAPFSREQFADEVSGAGIRHTGWFTDSEFQNGTVRGIVVNLPHGKWLAGYYMSDNGERVYFPEIHDNAKDAAQMADEHARVLGEQETEYQDKWRAAHDLQEEIEDALKRLRECVALRHNACMEYVRDEIAELLDGIRSNRETLKTRYADFI